MQTEYKLWINTVIHIITLPPSLSVWCVVYIRSQSVGAAEGVVGDGGGSSDEEAVWERPPPRPAAEETQATLSVSVQKPSMWRLKSKHPHY